MKNTSISERRLTRISRVAQVYKHYLTHMLINLELREWFLLSLRFSRFKSKYSTELSYVCPEVLEDIYVFEEWLQEINPIGCRIKPGIINYNNFK